MAPKINCNAVKLAAAVSYLQKSKTCHTIKDLEKQLPLVASINGMQVKDYLQTLQDDSKITVEKIGSGNWYWSFASQAKNDNQRALTEAQSNHEKATAVVEELRQKLADSTAAMAEGEEGEESREELMAQKTVLDADIKTLKKELATYSENDPTELEHKRQETKKLFAEVEKCTDDIQSMESWLSGQLGREALGEVQVAYYGEEFDAEEGGLREIVLE